MNTILFAIFVSVCSPQDICIDAVYKVLPSKQQCEDVIFEERIFTGECRLINGDY